MQKPRSNVYTMMLLLSLLAIITACVLLWKKLDTYGDYPYWKVPPNITTGSAAPAISPADFSATQP